MFPVSWLRIPAGFEGYFEELVDLLQRGCAPNPDALTQKYGLQFGKPPE